MTNSEKVSFLLVSSFSGFASLSSGLFTKTKISQGNRIFFELPLVSRQMPESKVCFLLALFLLLSSSEHFFLLKIEKAPFVFSLRLLCWLSQRTSHPFTHRVLFFLILSFLCLALIFFIPTLPQDTRKIPRTPKYLSLLSPFPFSPFL